MDLDRCTLGQRETVLALDAPLMVAAGAGSGKTFTLTQRIVYGFMPGTGPDGGAFLSSVNQVLAITFTRKAAAELRSRIKDLLAAEGFAEAALAVDDAWVTTIHGMASRILRENALELGIDPEFEVISESLQEELRHAATDRIIEETASLDDPDLRDFLASAPLFGRGAHGRGIVDEAQAILGRAASMPEGLDGVVIPEATMTPASIILRMKELGEEFAELAHGWEKPSKGEQGALAAVVEAIEAAERWLDESEHTGASFDEGGFDAEGFRNVLYAFPLSSATVPTKKNRSEFFDDYDRAYAELAEEAEAALGSVRASMLLRFARALDARYNELLGPDRLDQNELLRRCIRALAEHPTLAARYREQFELIMVDEFQDTDNLQVKLISLLARDGMANVCVVGDAQQSIYRFRGADVNVFFAYEKALRAQSARARFPKLTDNFRSHRDVLGFVDALFSQPEAFGERFLRLDAKGRVNEGDDPLFAKDGTQVGAIPSRATLDVIAYDPYARNETKVRSAEAVTVVAEHVADHFARLIERGAEPQDMALLLGGMASADVFAAALRERGIESVITGGSVFTRTRAAQLVGALLRYAVNREDGAALFEVLTSPLFALSDDCLLHLCTRYDEAGALEYGDLSRGFARAAGEAEHKGLSSNDGRALDLALTNLRRFSSRAMRGGAGRASVALRALFVETGALDRLRAHGAEGAAQAGNLQKALLIVERLEGVASGIASLSFAYDEHIRTAKEAPGLLSSTASLPLRIMTIHASKGLQFDHVAVAEAGDGRDSPRSLIAENVGERTYVSIAAPTSTPAAHSKVRAKLRKVLADEDEWVDAGSIAEALGTGRLASSGAGAVRTALSAWAKEEARSEAQRLLYVALTRAVKSVYLAVRTSAKPDGDYASAGIYREAYAAFPWDPASQRSRSLIDFGGTMPAEVIFEKLVGSADDDEGAADEGRAADDVADAVSRTMAMDGRKPDAPEPFIVPIREPLPAPHLIAYGFGRENVRSYSSLDHAAYAAETAEGSSAEPAESVEMGPYEGAPCDPDDSCVERAMLSYGADEDATALGTAFHRLAQRAILLARRGDAPHLLAMPEPSAVEAQARAQGLSEGQRVRLRSALECWFGSALAREFGHHGSIAAEVPFIVRIERDGRGPLYLEGEIDGLAFDDAGGRAFFIDYKTGGSDDETPEQLHRKHLQQAQCYAYALMREGFSAVEARFVRVERPCAADPAQPSVVKYSFDAGDLPELEAAIVAAAR